MEESNYIIGRNAVKEVLKSGRSVDALYVQEGQFEGSLGEIVALAKRNHVIVKPTPKKKLNAMATPYGHDGAPGTHQGVIAKVASVHYATVDALLLDAKQKEVAPFFIILDGITDPQNLGAIVRSAVVLGANGIILPSRRSASMDTVACKVASGAEEYIKIAKTTNLVSTIEALKQEGIWIACADMDGQSAYSVNLTGPLALIIGAEGKGVSPLVKKHSDYVVKIDVLGEIQSLNAATAAAILMYEKARQESKQL